MSAVLRPRSLHQALADLATHGAELRPLAGGTDLMVEFASGRSAPALVLDLSAIDELRGIAVEDAGLRVGALVTCAQLIAAPRAEVMAPMLVSACHEIGARQIQARATLGGNLGTASPASDLIPVLFALDARVRVAGPSGLRQMRVRSFIRGYRKTALAADELIESILLPHLPADRVWAWRKVGTRAAQSIAKVVVAMSVGVHGQRITSVCAAAGSVAEQCIALPTLESMLIDRIGTPEILRAAARAASVQDARPVDDVRSSARYRRNTLARVLERLLADCLLTG